MTLLQPWVGLVSAVAAAAVAVVVVWITVRRRHDLPGSGDAPIANVGHAEASAVFRRLRRRYHVLLGGEVVALSIVGLAAVGLTMRPATDRQLERDVRNRDVMLCLDVSASMNTLDAIVLRQFAELAAGMRGERIGLTIFNGSAITVFPLTDDAAVHRIDARGGGQRPRPAQAIVRRGHRGGRHLVDRRWPGVVCHALRR